MVGMGIVRARHSVREYTDKALEGEVLEALRAEIEDVRKESGLDIQLVLDNPEVYNVVARFGLIHGCTASIAFLSEGPARDVEIGYWGQRIVLRAQELGLNTCWVALCNRKKSKAELREGRSVRLIAAIGYGVNGGYDRKTKSIDELSSTAGERPAWFDVAMEAAQLAPTALNAQNFHVELLEDGESVRITSKPGGWRQVDEGIVRRNFEIGANETGATWRWA